MKISYFMHVPWSWIKQRPHFFAEMLSDNNHVNVFYERAYGRKRLVKNITNLSIREIFRLPFNRFALIRRINRLLVKFRIRKNKADIIWLTNAELYYYLSDEQKRIPIVYDCMDDVLEFPNIKTDALRSKEIFEAEKILVEKSKLLVFSSDYLRNVVLQRYNIRDKGIVVNNGVKLYDNNCITTKGLALDFITSTSDVITYVGTISSWFDFELILATCEKFPSVHFALIGPAEIEIPQHSRLTHFGPVKHEEIATILENSRMLVMPFIVNDLIKSVNPVKVYEYINSGNLSLINRYEETEKFDEYVYRYRSPDDFFNLIESYVSGNLFPKKSRTDCKRFAEENTWEKRSKVLKYEFNKIFK